MKIENIDEELDEAMPNEPVAVAIDICQNTNLQKFPKKRKVIMSMKE